MDSRRSRRCNFREDFVTAVSWLKAHSAGNGKVGAVGFCYGGGIVNMLATRVPDLAAGVAFYGSSPNVEDVPKIKSAIMVQSAEVDERINASWPAYEEALKAAKLRRCRREARVGSHRRILQQARSLVTPGHSRHCRHFRHPAKRAPRIPSSERCSAAAECPPSGYCHQRSGSFR